MKHEHIADGGKGVDPAPCNTPLPDHSERVRTNDYTVSKRVGRYVGPILTVLFLSEMVTLHIYETPVSPHVVYLNGFVLLLLGFYLVSRHNVWTKGWPVLITISAWAMTALGLFRLFFPTAPQAPVSILTYIMLAVFTCAEIFITYKSYSK